MTFALIQFRSLRSAVVLVLSMMMFMGAQAQSAEHPRTRQNFDDGWSFHKGDFDEAKTDEAKTDEAKTDEAKTKLSDSSDWSPVDLPHDFGIEGPFDEKNPSGGPGGYLPGGIGWYRKTFQLPESAAGKRVSISFDGVYMNSEVWINGHSLGKRPYGFVGFNYDLTPYLLDSGDNVLEVKVDNSLQPSSRWYTGTGIYRHVWLTSTDKLRVDQWGTQVSTPKITPTQAEVAVNTTLKNDFEEKKKVVVSQQIIDSDGSVVASVTGSHEITAGAFGVMAQTLEIPAPKLWSPESPSLYTLRTELHDGDRLADRYETTLGVREINFDPDKGFFLNGNSVIMKGVCNHDDLGPLGASLWDQALERRLRMLKEMGCNAIRTAHNPPPPELLDMCDRMGFLVVDETFDKWRLGWGFKDGKLVAGQKSKQGYALHLDQWYQQDLTDHLLRDRNHPSVIMWSVGNEVPEAQAGGELETVKKMQDLCHQLDPTRPVTVGCNLISGANESGFAELLDAVGYNGGGGSCFQYEADHVRYPQRFIYASEVPHSLQTRGEYRTLSRFREKEHQPADLTETEVFPETNPKYESSYDNAGVRISARASWRLTKTLPFVAGEFRWTGFDYIGESGGWPRVLGNFGIIDLCNFPKDTYYFYQSQWTEKPMVHLLPHWTWPGKEGTTIPVWCYSNCDSVELFLNGKTLGRRKFTPESDMHLEWPVPYQPGELKAVATQDGQVVATTVTRTAGETAQVKLSADQTTMTAGSRDLSYVTIRAEDEHGNFVPKAAQQVTLEIEGPGRVLAIGNGDPLSHESFQGSTITTFNGLALVIIVATGDPGDIVLTARCQGLEPVVTRISVK